MINYYVKLLICNKFLANKMTKTPSKAKEDKYDKFGINKPIQVAAQEWDNVNTKKKEKRVSFFYLN